MKRVAIYVRVSSDEQKKHGLSVDNQIDACRDWVEQNGYVETGLYNDAGISARKRYTKRPALLQLMKDCKEGLVDLIIFTKLDRWFRSVGDYYEVQSILDSTKVPWRAIWEDYETETSTGVFKVNIMLSVAQAEADRTSERVKAILDYKQAQGQYVGCVPVGLKRVNGNLERDEATAPHIEAMFKYYFQTQSVRKTAELLQRDGYTTNRSTVTQRLKNRVYCGDAKGSKCYSYITEEQHETIKRYLKDRTRTVKNHNGDYMFTGLLRCGYCGGRMAAKVQHNIHADGTEAPCKYYVCLGTDNNKTHKQRISISEARLEAFLLAQIEPALAKYNIGIKSKQKRQNGKDAETLKQRLQRIGDRYEIGELSIEEYKSKVDAIKKEIHEIELSEREKKEIVMPCNWRDVYSKLDVIHKRAFWKSFIDYIEVTRENKESPDIIFKS